MGIQNFRTYTCDNPSCPGDGVVAGPVAVVVPEPAEIPLGWLYHQGGITIQGGAALMEDRLFHVLACYETWYTDYYLPTLVTAIG